MPVSFDRQRAVVPDGIMRRRELARSLQHGPRVRDVAVVEVVVQRHRVELTRQVRIGQGQQGLQLAGEDQAPAVVAIDQRLLAHAVAC